MGNKIWLYSGLLVVVLALIGVGIWFVLRPADTVKIPESEQWIEVTWKKELRASFPFTMTAPSSTGKIPDLPVHFHPILRGHGEPENLIPMK